MLLFLATCNTDCNVAVAVHAKLVETSIIIITRRGRDLEGIPKWLPPGRKGSVSSYLRANLPGAMGGYMDIRKKSKNIESDSKLR